MEDQQRFLAAGKGFAFAVEIYGFFSHTASVDVSDTICQVCFFFLRYWKMLTKKAGKI